MDAGSGTWSEPPRWYLTNREKSERRVVKRQQLQDIAWAASKRADLAEQRCAELERILASDVNTDGSPCPNRERAAVASLREHWLACEALGEDHHSPPAAAVLVSERGIVTKLARDRLIELDGLQSNFKNG